MSEDLPPEQEKSRRQNLQEKYNFYFEEITKNPHALHLIVSLADTCLALNKRKEALLYYKRALTINPADEYIRNLMQGSFSPDEMKGLVFMPKAKPFWQDLGPLLKYPLKRHGAISLFAGSLAGAVLNSVPLVGGYAIIVFFLPYIFSFLFVILQSSIRGEIMLPNWPDISDLWETVIRPFIMVMTALTISFWPIVLYWLFETNMHLRLQVLVPAGLVFGVVYMPMTLLVVATYENMLAPFQVRMIFTAIWKIRGHYLVILCAAVCGCIIEGLFALFMPYGIFLIGPFIFWFITFYLSIILMRILGNIYSINVDRLAWRI